MTPKTSRCIIGAILALATISLAVPGTRADDLDEATQITFLRPVRIPGKVLPVGTYLFKSLPTLSDDSYGVVRIYNADGTTIYGTFLTKYAMRSHTSAATQLSFARPKSKAQPLTLLTWFYPGSSTGHQFVYPRREADQITEEQKITLDMTRTGTVSARVM